MYLLSQKTQSTSSRYAASLKGTVSAIRSEFNSASRSKLPVGYDSRISYYCQMPFILHAIMSWPRGVFFQEDTKILVRIVVDALFLRDTGQNLPTTFTDLNDSRGLSMSSCTPRHRKMEAY